MSLFVTPVDLAVNLHYTLIKACTIIYIFKCSESDDDQQEYTHNHLFGSAAAEQAGYGQHLQGAHKKIHAFTSTSRLPSL